MGGLVSRPWTTLATLGVLLGMLGVAGHELWTADEPRVAAIGLEMWETGSWAVPRLGGEAFLEKPPLFWWLEVAVFEAVGSATAATARLTSALLCFGALLLTHALARRFFSPTQALLGALVLLGTALFVVRSHWIVVDTALLFCTTAAFACYAHQLDAPAGRARALLRAGLYAALIAAFFAKGVVGVAIPALGMACHLAWTRRLRAFLGWHLAGGAAVGGVLAGLWLWRVWLVEGSAGVFTFAVTNQVGRFLPLAVEYHGGHERPLYYYLLQGLVDLLPWTPILVLAALAARRHWAELGALPRDGLRLVVASCGSTLLALSLAGTKRGLYLLPLAPLFSIAAGWWMGSALPRTGVERRFAEGYAVAIGLVVALGAVGLAVFEPASHLRVASGLAAWAALAVWLHRVDGGDDAARWLRIAVFVCAGWAVVIWSGESVLERHKGLRPLGPEELVPSVPPGAPLHLYRPSETTLGLLVFYTDLETRRLADAAALAALASAPGRSLVVVEGRGDSGTYARVRASGLSHELVASTETSSGRRLHLISVGGAADDGGSGPW